MLCVLGCSPQCSSCLSPSQPSVCVGSACKNSSSHFDVGVSRLLVRSLLCLLCLCFSVCCVRIYRSFTVQMLVALRITIVHRLACAQVRPSNACLSRCCCCCSFNVLCFVSVFRVCVVVVVQSAIPHARQGVSAFQRTARSARVRRHCISIPVISFSFNLLALRFLVPFCSFRCFVQRCWCLLMFVFCVSCLVQMRAVHQRRIALPWPPALVRSRSLVYSCPVRLLCFSTAEFLFLCSCLLFVCCCHCSMRGVRFRFSAMQRSRRDTAMRSWLHLRNHMSVRAQSSNEWRSSVSQRECQWFARGVSGELDIRVLVLSARLSVDPVGYFVCCLFARARARDCWYWLISRFCVFI